MKFKVLIISVLFVCSLLIGISLAHNKVVVVPLFSDCSEEITTVTSANGRVWMDRNLGADRVAESADDPLAYGWLFQWGRLDDGHQVPISNTNSTLSNGDVPGHTDFITTNSDPNDWRSPQNDNLWQGVSGINNPCPSGFRLPTNAEWETETASWSSKDEAGAFASPLKLVAAGYRDYTDGSFSEDGYFWSSTTEGPEAYNLELDNAILSSESRAWGQSVRCIKD